jgi:hypothetical protein
MGRGLHLTIDEWFFHWFDDEEKYKEVTKLFLQIFEVCDKIVLQKGNRHNKKFEILAERSSNFPKYQRDAVKILMNLFLRNSDKIYYVESTSELEKELNEKLPRKDVYLVEMSLAAKCKYFVTTDVTLFENLNETFEVLGIKAFMAEDFIKLYPNIIP